MNDLEARSAASAPTSIASRELDELRDEVSRLERIARGLSRGRLMSFGLFVVGLAVANSSLYPGAALAIVSTSVFLVLLVRHARVLAVKSRLEMRLAIGEDEAGRAICRRREREVPDELESERPLDNGEHASRPEPPTHRADAGALDDLGVLEGPRTLFGFLDLSSTIFGARRLRRALMHPLRDRADIETRQRAVAEIAEKPGLPRSIVECLYPLRRQRLDGLPAFLEDPRGFRKPRTVTVLANVLGTVSFTVFVAAFFWLDLWALAIPLFLINMAVIAANVGRANPLRDRLLLLRPLLHCLLALHATLESAGLESRIGREMREDLAALAPFVRRLLRQLAFLELHSFGIIFEIIDVIAILELRVLPLAGRLVKTERERLEAAISALAECECLVSLAAPLVEQPDFVMPEALEDEAPRLEANELGHPLLEAKVAVRNPLRLGVDEKIWILTGSNMAGKSTFLKAAGVNLVLAAAGGPVCARGFRWTPMRLFTDINVRDSLDNGKSYFQVEVERVRDVIAASSEDRRIIGIFDELFRGTNSVERLAICRSVIRHLRDRGVLVLVATHDLALTRLVTEEKERGMANRHLREIVEGTQMRFDYTLREGPATSRNAIRVLEVSGYPESVVASARSDAGESSA